MTGIPSWANIRQSIRRWRYKQEFYLINEWMNNEQMVFNLISYVWEDKIKIIYRLDQ